MSKAILILGESGAGKSTSIETLDPKTTAIVNVVGKDLPFKGWKSKYTPYNKADNTGNMIETHQSNSIVNFLKHIDSTRPDIKTIVIDDAQYLMSYDFMARAKEKGFDKFTDMALNYFNVINTAKSLRKDLTVFVMSHVESGTDVYGDKKVKIKTLGKLIDDKITIEGLFTIVLLAQKEIEDEKVKHYFLTNNDGSSTCKSPKGMFDEKIPNDLQYVLSKIEEYEN